MRLFPKLFLILLTLSLIILNSISCKLNLLGRGEFYLLIATVNSSSRAFAVRHETVYEFDLRSSKEIKSQPKNGIATLTVARRKTDI